MSEPCLDSDNDMVSSYACLWRNQPVHLSTGSWQEEDDSKKNDFVQLQQMSN